MPTTIDMPTTNMLPLLLKALKTDNIVNLYVIKTDTTFTIDLRKYRKIPKKIFNNIKLKPNFKSIQQKFVLRKIINNINKTGSCVLHHLISKSKNMQNVIIK